MMGNTGSYRIVIGNAVLGLVMLRWVIFNLTRSNLILLDSIGQYWILLDITGYYWILLDVTCHLASHWSGCSPSITVLGNGWCQTIQRYIVDIGPFTIHSLFIEMIIYSPILSLYSIEQTVKTGF